MNANNNEYILVTKIMIVLLPYLTSIVVTNKYTELRTNIRSIAVLKLTEAKPICTFFRARLHADAVCFFLAVSRGVQVTRACRGSLTSKMTTDTGKPNINREILLFFPF